MGHIPTFNLNTYRDQQNHNDSFLYFEWQGNSLIVERPHVHDFFMLLLTETSEGTHTIDFVNHDIKGRQLHFLFPGQVHYWQLASNTIAYQLMINQQNFYSEAAELMPIDKPPVIEPFRGMPW
jgi:hypothetical protein